MDRRSSYRDGPPWDGGRYSDDQPYLLQYEHAPTQNLPGPPHFSQPHAGVFTGQGQQYSGPSMHSEMSPAPSHLRNQVQVARSSTMVLERCPANDNILISALLDAEKEGILRSSAIEGLAVSSSLDLLQFFRTHAPVDYLR